MRRDRLLVSAISIRSVNNYCIDCQLLPFPIKCHIWSLECSSASPLARALQCHANIEMRSCGKGNLFSLCPLAEMRCDKSICVSSAWFMGVLTYTQLPPGTGGEGPVAGIGLHTLCIQSPSGAMCWDSTCFKALLFAVCSCLPCLEIPRNTNPPLLLVCHSSSDKRVIDS